MRLVLLATLLLVPPSLAVAQAALTPERVDGCSLLESADFWRGKLVAVEGPIGIPVEGPFSLETAECKTSLPGDRRRFGNVIELLTPGPNTPGRRVNFTWDYKSQRQLDDAVGSFDPSKDLVIATVVGVFETSRNRAAGDDSQAEDLAHLLVKTVTGIKTVPRKATPSEAELRAYEALREARAMTLWKRLLQSLLQSGGERYFEESVRGAKLPGGDGGIHFLYGRVVRVDSWSVPITVDIATIAAENDEMDVRLRLDGSQLSDVGDLKPGVRVRFRGVAARFSPVPFRLEFDVGPGDIVPMNNR